MTHLKVYRGHPLYTQNKAHNTFKERVTISPLRFEGHFTTHVTEGVRMTLNISLT